MCDDDSFDDMALLSRRGFGSLSLGVGLASLLPIGCNVPAPTAPPSAVIATSDSEVTITTPDGACDAYFVHPTNGAAPAVLVWPDLFGLRPAFRQMGKRLAESGYAVLVVNPFYRTKKAPTSSPHADPEDPATREAMMSLMHSLTPETAVADAKALTAWLDQQSSVDKSRKMGTTGYCMGGALVMRTAATNPERIGAAATFHGGSLVTDKPDSPPSDPEDEGAFPHRNRRERRHQATRCERDSQGCVRRSVSSSERRSVRRDEARLVSARFARV